MSIITIVTDNTAGLSRDDVNQLGNATAVVNTNATIYRECIDGKPRLFRKIRTITESLKYLDDEFNIQYMSR